MTHYKQFRKGCQHVDLAAVLEHAPQAGLLKSELLLDHAERVLALGADGIFGCFDQIIQSPIRWLGQDAPFAWSHGNAEGGGLGLHFRPLLDALMAGVGVNHLFLTLEQLSGWGEVMHVGGRGLHGVDQA